VPRNPVKSISLRVGRREAGFPLISIFTSTRSPLSSCANPVNTKAFRVDRYNSVLSFSVLTFALRFPLRGPDSAAQISVVCRLFQRSP